MNKLEETLLLNKKKYSSFLDGKRVVLIGPSSHTKKVNQKKLIHSYDVVVRMNVGYKYPDKLIPALGKRADVYYCSMSTYFFNHKTFKYLLDYKPDIKWIVGTGHHRGNMKKIMKRSNLKHINKLNVDSSLFKEISKKLRKKATSGIIVISDLLTYNIKELFITGMTFYNSSFLDGRKKYYYSRYTERNQGSYPVVMHDNKSELKIFHNKYNSDKRIKCDEMLTRILGSF